MHRSFLTTAARVISGVAFLLGLSATAHAQAGSAVSSTRCGDGLKKFGPLNEFGYPGYYVDQANVPLDHCNETTDVDPLCGNPPFGDPLGGGLPFDAPPNIATGNFWGETFYYLGGADAPNPFGNSLLVLAVEGVWDNATEAIIDGDQLVFSRIRVRIDLPNDPAAAGTYVVTHPYGVDTFEVTEADIAATAGIRAINFTDDCLHTVVGGVITPSCAVANGDQFTNVLADLTDGTTARISHYLSWDPAQSAPPAGYIGDPAIPHTVIGSSCGTNFFKIEGPAFPGGAMTDEFLLQGRIAHICGDGFVDTDLGEQCDDGNDLAGDCCSATCTFEAAGSACTDGDVCTDDACDGAGLCVGTPNTAPCNDGNPCTSIDTCSGGVCAGTPNTIPCDDGNACTIDDTCAGGLCVGGTPPCPAAQVVADASIVSSSASTNFGTATLLEVDGSPIKQTYMRINATNIAVPLASATLRMTTGPASSAASNSGGRVHLASCAWNENTLTWNNRPGFAAAILDTEGAVARNQVVDLDITGAITGNGDNCVALDSVSSDGVDYNSRQAAAAVRPQVILTSSCACAVPTTTTTTTTTLAPTTTTTLAPPAGIVTQVLADARTEITNPNTNFGSSTILSADADSAKHTFLRVSVTGTGGVVNNATIRMRVANVNNAQSNTGGRIQRITGCAWNESTITWNNKPALDGVPGPAQGPVVQNQVVDFNVTSLVPGDGTYCFVITSDSADGVDYNSREFSTAASRPQFIVN